MVGRKLFALIFTASPPAADVVREDKTDGPLEQGKEVKFSCFLGKEKGKDIYQDGVKGVILYIGLQKHLKVIFVDENKNRLPDKEGSVGTRRSELEKARMRQVNAGALHVHEINRTIQDAGPSEACQHQSVNKEVNRLPKAAKGQKKEELKLRIKNLVCFKPSTEKTNLFNKGVYMCPYALARYRRKYGLKPKKLYIKLLKANLTKRLLAENGISTLGQKGCVGVPRKIPKVALAYALSVFKDNGGDPKTVVFNPDRVVENLITNCRRLKKENKDLDVSSDEEDSEDEDSGSLNEFDLDNENDHGDGDSSLHDSQNDDSDPNLHDSQNDDIDSNFHDSQNDDIDSSLHDSQNDDIDSNLHDSQNDDNDFNLNETSKLDSLENSLTEDLNSNTTDNRNNVNKTFWTSASANNNDNCTMNLNFANSEPSNTLYFGLEPLQPSMIIMGGEKTTEHRRTLSLAEM